MVDSSVWKNREFEAPDPVLIRRVRDPYGWLGNMSRYKVVHEGVEYPSTEHLFQCLRVEDEELRQAICDEPNAFKAKLIAKKHQDKRVIECLTQPDLDNMRLCLRLKVDQHPSLKDRLVETEDLVIVEDCTKRPHGTGLFWGALHQQGDTWVGMNWLGELWMELRSEILKSRGPENPIGDLFT